MTNRGDAVNDTAVGGLSSSQRAQGEYEDSGDVHRERIRSLVVSEGFDCSVDEFGGRK